MSASALFSPELIQKYDVSGPRYTSYPTAVQFTPEFDETAYVRHARENLERHGDRPLSLYFHLPFCASVCYYCACNKIITNNRRHAADYLERLFREIGMQAALHGGARPVSQLHWGGGTPTFFDEAQMSALMRVTGEHFTLLGGDAGDYSLEVDPRTTPPGTIERLRELGFNRISLGVQDFAADVQLAVNRVQSEEETRRVVDTARASGFRTVSLDLIYGLPRQSLASFDATLDRVLDIRPDRLSVFNYAHLPHLFKTQKQIDAAQLPAAAEKLAILERSIERLTDAGYVYIGMDHFALPDDELSRAQRDDTLYRNFQGYSTHSNCDLVAMGMSSIGMLTHSYSQNIKEAAAYYAALDAGRLPIARGVELSEDDRIRRDAITRLICHFHLGMDAFSKRWNVDFKDYFAQELARLAPLADDGLVDIADDEITVLPPGRLLIRLVCMTFDKYLEAPAERTRFSRAI
jgi:oxygen-independent coproporphyrinogen-3 oxidase